MVRRFSTLLASVLLSGRLVDFLLHHFVAAHESRIAPEGALTFDADMTPGMEGELHSGKVKSEEFRQRVGASDFCRHAHARHLLLHWHVGAGLSGASP